MMFLYSELETLVFLVKDAKNSKRKKSKNM
jgi:hypothetical protein